MRYFVFFLIFFHNLLFCTESLHISKSLDALELIGVPKVFKDTQRRDYNEAYALLNQNKFETLPLHVKSFGVSHATYWVALTIKNQEEVQPFIEFQYNQLSHVDCFVFKKNSLIHSSQNGSSIKINEREVKHLFVRFALIKADAPLMYLFKITSDRPVMLAMKIAPESELDYRKLPSIVFIAFFTGCLFILLCFNFMLYLVLKAKEYLFYTLYLVSLWMFIMYIHHYTFWLVQEFLWFNNVIKILSTQGVHVAFLLFTLYFLDIHLLCTFLTRVTYILCFIAMFTFFFLAVQSPLQMIACFTGMMILAYTLFLGFFALFKKVNFAKWYLIGVLGFYCGTLLFWLMQLGVIEVPSMGINVLLWGSLWQMLIFTCMLILKIKLIKSEYKLMKTHILETEKERIYQSRYISIGRTIGNIAHQWKQPLNALGAILTNMKGSLILEPRIKRKNLITSLDTSFEVLKHLSETIDTFYNFLLKSYATKRQFYVSEELEAIQKMLAYSFQNSSIQLNFHGTAQSLLLGNPNEFIQVLLNILLNAKDQFDAMNHSHPSIDIGVYENDQTCIITIQDNAGGIKITPVERIFEFNITTKHESAGVGLFICQDIITNRFKGTLSVENRQNGACFTITIPK